jgi:hypothetical protein
MINNWFLALFVLAGSVALIGIIVIEAILIYEVVTRLVRYFITQDILRKKV